MSDGTGYLLPAGDAYTDDIACTLVFYPNKDEYRRALLGSLHYLATWLAWERDTAKRGKDAARAWKDANELTMECWQMACLEQLQADVAAIRQMMSLLGYCCDGSITYGPPTVVDPPFIPGVGDPPATYGETTIADWDDWTEYACYNADAYVDFLIQQAESFAAVAQNSAWTIGLVAAGLALLSFTGIGLPIAYALASTVLFGLLQAGSGIFDDVAEDIEANRTEIRCAILQGDSLQAAVGDAIGTSSPAWLALFQFVDYGSAASIIQSGGYGTEYLPAEASTVCGDCTYDDDWQITGVDGTGQTIGTVTVDEDAYDAYSASTHLVGTASNCGTRANRRLIAKLTPISGTPVVNRIQARITVTADVARSGCSASYDAFVKADYSSSGSGGCIGPSGANIQTLDTIAVPSNGGFSISTTYQVSWENVNLGTRVCVWITADLTDYNFTSQDVLLEIHDVLIE
jgi:hypothetical protein